MKLKNQEVAALESIDVTGESWFFVKLKEYPYEFEIDENLHLASVDGVKVANGSGSSLLIVSLDSKIVRFGYFNLSSSQSEERIGDYNIAVKVDAVTY